jgi:localization factor PodJL
VTPKIQQYVQQHAQQVLPPTPQPPAPAPAPAAKRMPAAHNLPINPDLPPDEPLEPGSGPPKFRANPAARIAASEAALGGAGPAASGGKSGFIAAARRAANAALQTKSERAAPPPPPDHVLDLDDPDAPSLSAKMTKRIKSLFIAASLVAIAVGSVQIASNFFEFGKTDTSIKTALLSDKDDGEPEPPAPMAAAPTANAPVTFAVNPLAAPKLPVIPATPSRNSLAGLPLDFTPNAPSMPSLLAPPALNPQPSASRNDVTGSIPRTLPSRAPAANANANIQPADRLPSTIGGNKLRSAAVAGDAAAAYEVAVRFAEGRGVPVSLEDAAYWYERASNKGLAPAQFRYASLLEKGQGVKKDLVQARRLYISAAGKGNGKAMHNLAVLYAEGIEGKPDYATAAQWFRKAAQHGIADSQYNLGVLCARGLGTEKSITESYKWFSLAAAQGDRESAKKRDELAALLDSAALAAVQQSVQSFVAEPQPSDAIAVAEPAGGWDGTPVTPAPRTKSRTVGPMSLGALETGKR